MSITVLKRLAVITAILILVAVPFVRAEAADDAEIKIGGGSTALGSMQLLATAFQKYHPAIRFTIFPAVGSTGGFNATAAGAADIGLMGRPLREKEQSRGLTSIEYARTPLAFIAGEDVPVSGVTTEELVKIYRAETTQWANGQRIRLVLYTATDTDILIEKRISPEMSRAIDAAVARPGMTIALSTQEGYEKVRQIPGSLGFCSLTAVLTEKGTVKVLAYNGIYPSVKNLKNRSYPLFKSLYLAVKSKPSRPVQEFLDFISSEEGTWILEEAGNMPVPFKTPR